MSTSNPHTRTRSRSRSPPARPTTPLRPSSRTSLRSSTAPLHHPHPLDSLSPQFAELADSLADLDTNLLHLRLMHDSLSRFSENFAAFLYGLEMNAFVVDWPEQPLVESVARWRAKQAALKEGDTTMKTPTKSVGGTTTSEVDSTLLSDTTFASLRATPARRRTGVGEEGGVGRGGAVGRGRGGAAGTNVRGTGVKSGIPARSGSSASNATRGARGARGARGSGLPMRGRARGVK